MNSLKAITPLLWRVIAFMCLFVMISGIAGPRIISSDIFFRDGFGVYGSIGKALVFGLVAFILLARTKPPVSLSKWQPVLFLWLIASTAAFAISWMAVDGLIASQRTVVNLVLAHGGLLMSVAFAALACFGLKDIRRLYDYYRQQILLTAAIAIVFLIFLTAVYALWQPLATLVMYSVNALLELSGLTTVVLPPDTLVLDKFGITVAESCSGIESIALFTGLYAIVGILDWQRLQRRRYFIVFPFALLLLAAFNILRVYGLIMAGYFINPEIAFSLFHTYAGLVFFVIYSAIFWAIAYKYLTVKPQKETDHA